MIYSSALWHIVVLFCSLVITTSDAIYFREKVTVIIQGDIKDETIVAHCYSSDDDLGTHTLSSGQQFSFKFRVNLFQTTKFFCDFYTSHGSGTYGVFTKAQERHCHGYCVWYVKQDGLCLKNYDDRLLCQEWKNKRQQIGS